MERTRAGFCDLCWVQTLFDSPEEIKEIEPVRAGHGEGDFVVAKAISGKPGREEWDA